MTEPLDALQAAEDRYNDLHEVLTLLEIAHRLLPDDAETGEVHQAIDSALAGLERLVDAAEKAVNARTIRPTSPRTH